MAPGGEGPVFFHPGLALSGFLTGTDPEESTPRRAPCTERPAPQVHVMEPLHSYSAKHSQGDREGVCVHAICVCVLRAGRGSVSVSQYEYGSDGGSEQPALRDNQAEAAVEGEGKLRSELDH